MLLQFRWSDGNQAYSDCATAGIDCDYKHKNLVLILMYLNFRNARNITEKNFKLYMNSLNSYIWSAEPNSFQKICTFLNIFLPAHYKNLNFFDNFFVWNLPSHDIWKCIMNCYKFFEFLFLCILVILSSFCPIIHYNIYILKSYNSYFSICIWIVKHICYSIRNNKKVL